jgi:hypothetical protein
MQAGNLVMIARTSVGVPANTMALLIENQKRLGKTPVWQCNLWTDEPVDTLKEIWR